MFHLKVVRGAKSSFECMAHEKVIGEGHTAQEVDPSVDCHLFTESFLCLHHLQRLVQNSLSGSTFVDYL